MNRIHFKQGEHMRRHLARPAVGLLVLLALAFRPVHAEEQKATAGAVKLGFAVDKTAALAEAARDQKPLLAFFTTDW